MHAERTDLTLSHDFKDHAPYDGMNAEKFSVYGMDPFPESGWYEFFVKTPNGFEFASTRAGGLQPSMKK